VTKVSRQNGTDTATDSADAHSGVEKATEGLEQQPGRGADSSGQAPEKPVACEEGNREHERLPLRQLLGSVLAAALGVQSSRNRERDFRHGRALTFIVAGIVFTALFIGGVLAVVKLVLATR
jgi:hypothetical protein